MKPGADRLAIELLQWLGIDWDSGPLWQSTDLSPYREAMDQLARLGLSYASDLSRTEVERLTTASDAVSAPQEGSHEVRFPASLRPTIDTTTRARGFDDDARTWRFTADPGPVSFSDRFAGPRTYDVAEIAGDFIIWTRQRMPAYQLAVVVDDAAQGVTEIVRGDDLLDSAARQLLLYRALGLQNEPQYTHLPLVRGEDGRRLAKRHGDTRLDSYRAQGVPAERVIGLIAYWCALTPRRTPMTAAEFCSRFSLDTMPVEGITFGPEDDAWLRRGDQ